MCFEFRGSCRAILTSVRVVCIRNASGLCDEFVQVSIQTLDLAENVEYSTCTVYMKISIVDLFAIFLIRLKTSKENAKKKVVEYKKTRWQIWLNRYSIQC